MGRITFRLKLQHLTLLSLFALVNPAVVSAQLCCTTGSTSTSTYELGVSPEKSLLISLGHEYNSLEGAFSGRSRTEDPFDRKGTVQAYLFKAHYGISRRIGVSVSLPYVIRTQDFGVAGKFTGDGLGDASVVLKYGLRQLNIASRSELAVGAGFKAPTGATDLSDREIELPYNLQPGTGTWDALFWIYSYRTFIPSPWSGSISALIKLSGTDLRNGNLYEFADEIFYSLVVNRRMSNTTRFAARIRGRTADRDKLNGFFIPGSGGTVIFFAPSVLWAPTNALSIEAGIDIPAFFSVEGIQQALQYRTFLDVSFFLRR